MKDEKDGDKNALGEPAMAGEGQGDVRTGLAEAEGVRAHEDPMHSCH